MSNTAIRRTTAVLGVFLAISFWPASKFKETRALAEAQYRSAARGNDEARLIKAAVDDLPRKSRLAEPLKDALSRTVATLNEEKDSHRVTITAISTAGGASVPGASGSDALSLYSFAEPVPGVGSLKRIRIAMKGSYRGYDQFAEFLDLIKSMPIALSSLGMEKNNFELTLDIYGT
jgi:hypothetical protein